MIISSFPHTFFPTIPGFSPELSTIFNGTGSTTASDDFQKSETQELQSQEVSTCGKAKVILIHCMHKTRAAKVGKLMWKLAYLCFCISEEKARGGQTSAGRHSCWA